MFTKDITKGCDIEPATVSIMLNKLESNGFIKRNYSEENKRNVYIQLTELGKITFL